MDFGGCSSAPPWAIAFPRLFEIYAASDQNSLDNWFQIPNVWSGLLTKSSALQRIEAELQEIDAVSWAVFKAKAAGRVHLLDEWGYSRALFDCIYEVKGYRYLLGQGYEEVRFLAEEQKAKTPDLRARAGSSIVLMEVKTVNESDRQKNYFEIPGEERIALDHETHLSQAFKDKLVSTIETARTQLLTMQDPSVIQRIIYLVIRQDFHVEADEELAAFLQGQTLPGVATAHYLLD